MPSALLLRLAGPMQSWGTTPFKERVTSDLPTLSGVLGLLGAGMGAPRGGLPPWFAGLSVTVRVDRPGTKVHDFHTINPPTPAAAEARGRMNVIERGAKSITPVRHVVRLASGAPSGGTEVTVRHYLADASFVAAISHNDEHRVEELHQAMRAPAFMTYLGRKACPPTFPFVLGVREGAPQEVLEREPSYDARRDDTVPVFQLRAGDRYERCGVVQVSSFAREDNA